MNELELLNKIKDNPSEFSQIFKLYYKPIFGYVFRRTGDFDETADITAETFFNAFSHINNFSYKGISIKVWLYRIATNEVNLFYRRKKKFNSLFDKLGFEDEKQFKNFLHQDKEELEIEIQKHEQYLIALNALKTLSDKYQDVITLRYFEGNNNKEIAEILNINEGTLKSLLSRGLKKLREICNQI